MSERSEMILLFCALYFMWILLPLIPSVLIYRIFPDTKTTAEGQVSNWKIKAGGAFGAYLAVLMAGYFLVDRAQLKTMAAESSVWRLKVDVQLQDQDGKPIRSPSLLDQLEVCMDPDIIQKKGRGYVDIAIPVEGDAPPSRLAMMFTIREFGQADIHLGRESSTRVIDPKRRLITESIVIQQETPYVHAAYMTPSSP